jgi:hypothetical protein
MMYLMRRLILARSTDAPSFGVFIGRLVCCFFIDSVVCSSFLPSNEPADDETGDQYSGRDDDKQADGLFVGVDHGTTSSRIT